MVKTPLPLQGVQVRSLVEELGSHMPRSVTQKKKREKQTVTGPGDPSQLHPRGVGQLWRPLAWNAPFLSLVTQDHRSPRPVRAVEAGDTMGCSRSRG